MGQGQGQIEDNLGFDRVKRSPQGYGFGFRDERRREEEAYREGEREGRREERFYEGGGQGRGRYNKTVVTVKVARQFLVVPQIISSSQPLVGELII